jgi:hypothetical protein
VKRCWRWVWRVLGGVLILTSLFGLLFFPSLIVLHTVCTSNTVIGTLDIGNVHHAMECADTYAIWHGLESGLVVGISLFLLSFKRRAA